jgi:hypothetical protein
MELSDELALHPGFSLPQALGMDEAALEAAYRFLGNAKVKPDAMVAPHFANSVARAAHHSVVYVAHDTTEVRHACSGLVLFLHLCIGVGTSSADDELVGALGAEFGQRTEKKPRRDSKKRKQDPERASLRWNRLVLTVHQQLQSVTSAIHLMDREADIYELLSAMHQAGVRFIVRAKADRVCVGPDGKRAHLFPTLDQATGQLTRQVPLSGRKAPWSPKDARRHPARESRQATLSTAAISVTVFKPQSSQDAGLPPSLQLNYVHVWEEHPPEGEAAVDWKLVTEEPCTTPEQIEAVVDGYRKRWRIEEFNKGLKTGCGIEKTQLETQSSVLSHVALAIPMAWRILRLRNLERQRPNDPATEALSPVELEVLTKMAKSPLDPVPTAAQVLRAVASLGGHLKRNGPPGWLTLMRGYSRLLDYVTAWRVAREM